MCISVTYTIEIVWFIKSIEGYGFGKDKNLYNLKTCRQIKQSYNGGSIGYWIGKNFYTLKKLKFLLYKPSKDYCPF